VWECLDLSFELSHWLLKLIFPLSPVPFPWLSPPDADALLSPVGGLPCFPSFPVRTKVRLPRVSITPILGRSLVSRLPLPFSIFCNLDAFVYGFLSSLPSSTSKTHSFFAYACFRSAALSRFQSANKACVVRSSAPPRSSASPLSAPSSHVRNSPDSLHCSVGTSYSFLEPHVVPCQPSGHLWLSTRSSQIPLTPPTPIPHLSL